MFIPRINQALESFKHHPLSTENNLSPMQLYIAYSLGSSLFEETVDPTQYGVEDNDDEDEDEDEGNNHVHVPEITIPLSAESILDLEGAIDPLLDCDDFGKQIYIDTVHYMFGLMTNDGLV